MGTLQTAMFTLSLDDADERPAGGRRGPAFTHALHGAGLTLRDAIEAWWRLETWENAGFPKDADPGPAWRSRMSQSSQALRQAWAIAAGRGCTVSSFRIGRPCLDR